MKKQIEKLNLNSNIKLKKKEVQIIFGIIFLMVFFTFSLVIASRLNSNKSELNNSNESKTIAKIFILEGGPRLSLGGDITRTIEDGESINEKEFTLITDSGSKALIVFSDNSLITLDNGSNILISNTSENEFNLNLNTGSSYIRGEKNSFVLNISDLQFKLATARAQASLVDKKLIFESIKNNIKLINSKNDFGEIQIAEKSTLTIESIENIGSKEEIEKLVSFNTDEDESNWKKLVNCIDTKVSSLLTSTNITTENYLIGKSEDILKCISEVSDLENSELNDKELENAKIKYQQELNKTKKQPPKITSVSINNKGGYLFEDSLVCSWAATGEDIIGYEYSIGTSAGSDDMYEWTKTLDTTVTLNSIGMKYGIEYYCNVRASNSASTSTVVSSSKITFDNSFAAFSINNPFSPPGDMTYDGTIRTNVPLNQLEVNVYLADLDGKYFDGTQFVEQLKTFKATLTQNESNIGFTINFNVPDESTEYGSGFILYFEAKNTKTGRIIEQITYDIP